MKCVLTETDTRDSTLLDILKGCKKYEVSKLVIETNFGDGIVSELFRKHLQQTNQSNAMLKKSEQLLEKKIESSIPLNPSLTNTDSLLTSPSSSGTSGLIPKLKLLKND